MRRSWFLGFALLSCGCGKDADRLTKVCSLTGSKFETLTGGVRNKLANGFQAARGETGVDSRVTTRLRWDKNMEGAEVRAQMLDGVLQLEGTIVNDEQQQRAMDLASATIGVEKVESKLTIREQK